MCLLTGVNAAVNSGIIFFHSMSKRLDFTYELQKKEKKKTEIMRANTDHAGFNQ